MWPLGGNFPANRQISGYDGLHRILLFSTNLSSGSLQHYDLGLFDHDKSVDNTFEPKSVTYVTGIDLEFWGG
jgi:hypothetical protein